MSVSPSDRRDMASAFAEEQFCCSICLDIFSNPCSIPCGHNFCLECIKHFWDTRRKSVCPLCKETFKICPDLRINVVLKDITDQFKKSLRSRSSYRPLPRQYSDTIYPCDVCALAAVKSCLVCRLSYCEAHLAPHLRDPVLTRHRLTDPGTFTHLCPNHNKQLGLFCRDDQTPLCVRCKERAHRNHDTVPIEMEGQRIRSKMKRMEEDVHQRIQARIRKMDEIKNSVEHTKIQKNRELQTSVEVFTMVVSAAEGNRDLAMDEMEVKQEATEWRAQQLLRELEEEVAELQKSGRKLQYLEPIEDPLHLLQSLATLSVLPASRDWSEVAVHSDLYIGRVRMAFSKLLETCHELERKLFAEEFDRITQYAVDVILDPATAAGWLIVSPDGKKVSISSKQKKLPDEPCRFDSCVSILGKQSFTSGKHYWTVQVGGKTDWDLGVARESINRKGAIVVRPDSGFWAICRRKGGSLSACAGPSVSLRLQDTPRRVAVFLDWEEGSVSFYDAEAKTHVYTYSGCDFTEPLYPYFNPGLQDNGKNAAPLVICPMEVLFTV